MQTNYDLPLKTVLPKWVHGFVLVLATLTVFLIASSAIVPHAGAQQARKAGMKPVASVQQVMTLMTIPASDVIFGAAGEAPKADSGWQNVQNNALLVAESGNLLMMPGRARDNQEWLEQARSMIDAAMIAVNAAAARDAKTLAEASDKIYSTCENCHNKYMTK
jgi:cytochrome c556